MDFPVSDCLPLDQDLYLKITGNQHQCYKRIYCIETVSNRQTEGLNSQQKAAKYIYDVFKTETTDNVLKQTSTVDELKTSLKHTNRRQQSWCMVFPRNICGDNIL